VLLKAFGLAPDRDVAILRVGDSPERAASPGCVWRPAGCWQVGI